METDEGSTRSRILDAALDEFAVKGLAGARVDQIAKRAGVNVRMIYYWFESKRGLYEAVNAHVVATNDDSLAGVTIDDVAADPFGALFGGHSPNPRFIRLLEWEELNSASGDDELVSFQVRSALAEERIALLSAAQEAGLLPADMDVRMLYFVMHALTRAPYAFPSLARYTTGIDPESDEFTARFRAFTESFGRLLTADDRKTREA